MAGLIPDELITRVREATNIVDVIGQYTTLTKKGRQWNGICAFHEERTPSLFVDENKQVFNCFSCGRSGSVIQFVMEKEGLTFPETIIHLAEQADIPLEGVQTQRTGVNETTRQLWQLQDEAQRLYHHILMNTNSGADALAYLRDKRQLTDDVLDTFKIGFAPTNNALLTYFKEQQISRTVLLASELFIEDDAGELRDRFAGRIVFPLRNERGQVVGFSGRALDAGNKIKYMNSPESPLFNKSRLLFNFDLARAELRQTRTAIVFEGFMDVIAAQIAGVPTGVATMGTALTPEHVQLLQKNVDRILLAYDGDAAGQTATKRALSVIHDVNPQLNVGIIQLPDKLDPDEVRLKYGASALGKALQKRIQTPLEFQIQAARADKNLSQENDYLAFINDVLQILATATPVEQDLHLARLSQEFGTSRQALFEQLQQVKPRQVQSAPKRQARPTEQNWIPEAPARMRETVDYVEQAEKALVMAVLKDAQIYTQVAQMANFQFVHPVYQTLFLMAGIYHQQHPKFQLATFLDLLQKPDLNQKMIGIDRAFGDEPVNQSAVNDHLKIILENGPLEQQIKRAQMQLQEAIAQQDDTKMLQATAQLVQLRKKQRGA
ncbi:MAG TPA: DNA primase [Lactobacillaceae bacterium]|jgi:DNA primase